MKKLFSATVLALAMTLSSFAQEGESTNYATLSVIPKLEGNFLQGEEKIDPSFGNSALYTKFEGAASEHFSWLLVNEWFAAPDEADRWWWLYNNLGRSDSTNWLQYALVNISFGSWTISVGKDMIQTGGLMNDDWDWDVHYPFTNGVWNSLYCYQWGGKVAWTTPSEKTNLCVQMTSSPWGEKPFASGLWTYSFCWRGNYGWFSNIWSYSAIQRADRKFDHIVALGQRAEFGNWTIGLDYTNMLDSYELPELVEDSEEEPVEIGFAKGYSFMGTVTYAPSETVDFSVKGMKATDRWFAGGQVQVRPFKNKDLFRIHAVAGYDSLFAGFTANAGITFNFDINLW